MCNGAFVGASAGLVPVIRDIEHHAIVIKIVGEARRRRIFRLAP
jgi:hypothetical protein